MKKKVWKKALCSVMVGTMIASSVPATLQADAAAKKAKVASTSIKVGEKKTLKVKYKPKKATLKWSSTNTKVVTVSKKGVIKGKAAGSAYIKVKVKAPKKKAYTIKAKITVKKPAQAPEVKIVAIAPEVQTKKLVVEDTYDIVAKVKPVNATNQKLSYVSSDESIATVSEDGKVTAVAPGSAVITISANDGSDETAAVAITVTEKYGKGKPRTILTTDGEVDDQDSFLRILLYANEMDIKGIVLSSSTYHWSGGDSLAGEGSPTVIEANSIQTKEQYDADLEDGEVNNGKAYQNEDGTYTAAPFRWTGVDWPIEFIDDYAKIYDKLNENADGYPTPEYLKSIYKIGNIKFKGEMDETTEGSDLIKDILLDDDDSPIYIQTWGGANTTARALYDIEQQYKGTEEWDAIYKKVCDKAFIYVILNQDNTFQGTANGYIRNNWPDMQVIHDPGVFWRFAYMWTSVDAPLKVTLQGSWMYENIVDGKGALLDNYRTLGDGRILEGEQKGEQRGVATRITGKEGGNKYDFISEGDSPSFFYLLDTGLRSLENPTYGGWGGRFGEDADGVYRPYAQAGGTFNASDFDPYTGKMDRNYPLTRWFNDLQYDFAARANWCVKDFADANHRPTIKVKEATVSVTEGRTTTSTPAEDPLNVAAKAGSKVRIMTKVTDPDGDSISYDWWQYYEADTYAGESDGALTVTGADTSAATITVPADAQVGDTIHMILQVKDDKSQENGHYMTHYQRVVITVVE